MVGELRSLCQPLSRLPLPRRLLVCLGNILLLHSGWICRFCLLREQCRLDGWTVSEVLPVWLETA
jgi:hypothetical protein